MFAGVILADVAGKDHIPLKFTPADPNIPAAFDIAGQGKMPQLTLGLLSPIALRSKYDGWLRARCHRPPMR